MLHHLHGDVHQSAVTTASAEAIVSFENKCNERCASFSTIVDMKNDEGIEQLFTEVVLSTDKPRVTICKVIVGMQGYCWDDFVSGKCKLQLDLSAQLRFVVAQFYYFFDCITCGDVILIHLVLL